MLQRDSTKVKEVGCIGDEKKAVLVGAANGVLAQLKDGRIALVVLATLECPHAQHGLFSVSPADRMCRPSRHHDPVRTGRLLLLLLDPKPKA